jgi:Fibronectin type III domain
MSETAPEPTPARSSSNVFTRKLGPLPLWAWMGIGLAVALGYYYFRQNKAAASASQSASSGQASTTASGTPSDLIPQFVNQTYVQNTPPQQPNPVPQPTPGATNVQADKYPAPGNTKAAKLNGTTAKVNWDYITGTTPKPTSYTIAVYQLNGKLAQQVTVNAPDTASGAGQATITGLHPGWQYNVNVWANGGKTAPPHSTAKLTLLWLNHVVLSR